MSNINIKPKRLVVAISTAILSSLSVTPVFAQGDANLEELVVVGSRVAGRSAEDLPVPVDTLSSEALERTGQTEVGRMLQALAPSFNFSSSSISDGTDALRPATLRGLGPDQTLVLINGKRRHQASLIHINTSVGRGTAGTDLNAIPAAAIERIEVLRDGAAAQYGSDAIAGVINIVLKTDAEYGQVDVSYGEFSEGDGETTNVNINKGFALGSEGYFNASLNFRDRGNTNRAGLHGSCQFPGCVDTDGDGILEPGDPREVTANRNTFRIGDADSEQVAFTLNAAYNAGPGEIYGFVTYSNRDNQSAAFFRHNANSNGNPPLADGDAVIPEGFLPKINSQIDDFSYNFGYRVNFDDESSLDISYTTGKNSIDYVTSDTINASFANELRFGRGLSDADIRAQIPRSGRAYGLELSLSTFNVDFVQNYGDLTIAIGSEIRTDEYKITAGERYGFFDYDTTIDPATNNPVSIYDDGNPANGDEDAAAGLQGFGGIGPDSEVDETRDVFSFYIDAEYEISDNALVSAAIRHDNYSGFGDTTNYKLAGSVGLTDSLRFRAAASTGFRAPSMQQLFFNNISTQFVDDPNNIGGPQIAVQVGTFRNDSELAGDIGIPQLKEEESLSFSAGFVLTPLDNLTITLDYYNIDIEDRIVISNRLGFGLSDSLTSALLASGAGAAQFFLNGADTETDGFDIVATYGLSLGAGDLDLTLSGNFTETEVTELFTPAGSGLSTVAVSDVFSEQDISIIEEWQPEDRISFSGNYTLDRFNAVLSLNRFGEYSVTDGGRQTYGAEIVTDLRLNYNLTESFSINVGGNNIFDVTPDENTIGNSRSGAIENGPDGDLIVDSNGVFRFSRRAAPFGFNGAYYYAGMSYKF
ncbi:TonB-dependent receptor plug domain-containing protein [Agarilytica rhodophyticola]|uniref:TonB-dependent receptor plug domain-containing protein n=1 Tax=Agarilytica rhodophyticola TaxID=1737490 RepID=UPI000B347E46|nr:TonB-dependent receptor [Agarilytica rhodophyticola]